MYEAFYGLSEKPFSILPDPTFLFWAAGHNCAYCTLAYGVFNRAGFTVITGEIGSGKTTLVRHLLREFDNEVTVGLISNTARCHGHLLEWVMMSLNQPFDGLSYVELYRRFRLFLIAEYAQGRHVVIIIDEAQNLDAQSLEELRMLSNVNADGDQLVDLILLGQPQLRKLLQQPSLVQFAQRVSAEFHLRALERDDVAAYIGHRLFVAGATRLLFDPRAVEVIAYASSGIPRLINILCDTCLAYGYAMSAPTISAATAQQVLDDKRQYGVFNGSSVYSKAVKPSDFAIMTDSI